MLQEHSSGICMASLFDGRSPVFGNDKWPILNHPGRCSYPILHNKRKEGRKEGRERRKERKEKGKKEKERKRKKASKKGTIKKKKKKHLVHLTWIRPAHGLKSLRSGEPRAACSSSFVQ